MNSSTSKEIAEMFNDVSMLYEELVDSLERQDRANVILKQALEASAFVRRIASLAGKNHEISKLVTSMADKVELLCESLVEDVDSEHYEDASNTVMYGVAMASLATDKAYAEMKNRDFRVDTANKHIFDSLQALMDARRGLKRYMR